LPNPATSRDIPLKDYKESLKDFDDEYDPLKVTEFDRAQYEKYLSTLTEKERLLLEADHNFYEITFANIGGRVMPLILEFEYEDGTKEVRRIPAEIWRYDTPRITKVCGTVKELKSVTLDSFLETADVETK
jgi:hypothetical protein